MLSSVGLLCIPATTALATSRYAVATGNWDATSTWSATSGGAAGASVPGTGDTVYIGQAAGAYTVTIQATSSQACGMLKIGSATSSTAATLTFAASTSSLVVGGDVIIYGPNAAATRAINVNAGALSIGGNLALSSGGTGTLATQISSIVVTTGSVTVAGNLTMGAQTSAAQSSITMSGGAGTFDLGGSFTLANGVGTLTPGTTSTFIYSGTGAQTIVYSSGITYANLTINKSSGTATLAASTTIPGNVTLAQGTLATSNFNLSIGGSWTNNGGTLSGGTSTVTFTGILKSIGGTTSTTFPALVIASASTDTLKTSISCSSLTFNASAAASSLTHATTSALTVNGDVTINQPTAAATTAWNINAGSASISGNVLLGGANTTTNRIAKVLVSTGTLTINGDLVYNGMTSALTAVVQFSSTGTLNLGGAMTLTNGVGTLTPGTTSTVVFNGTGDQTITRASSITYANVTINKASGAANLAAATTIVNVTLTQGTLNANGFNLTNTGNWTNNGGTFNGGATTVTMSGTSKTISGTTSTTFPGIILASGGTRTMSNSNSCTSLTFAASAAASSWTHGTTSTLTVNGNVTINQPSGAFTTAWNINAGSGIVTGNVTIGGTGTNTAWIAKAVVTTGSLTVGGNLVYNSSATTPQTAVVSISSTGSLNLAGAMTLTNGTGTLTPGTTSTVVFDGTGAQTIPYSSAITYAHLTINKASGTATLAAATTVINLTLSAGTLSVGAGNFGLTVSGNWTNNGGTFSGGTGTVTLSGTSKTITGTSPTTFATILIPTGATRTMNNSNSCTALTFAAAATANSFTHGGTAVLTVSGSVTMNQPTAAVTSAWNINAGSATVGGNVAIGGATTTASFISHVVITTGTLTIAGNLVYNSAAASAANAVVLMSGGAGTLNLAGALTLTSGSGTLTPGTTSTFNYNGALAQTITMGSAIVYNDLNVNNAAGATLSAAVTTANVLGNLRVQTGTMSNGGFAIVGNATKTFEVADGATVMLAGTSSMATGFGTRTFGLSSTVNYGGAAQTVTLESYGNLTLSSSGGAAVVKTMPASPMTIAGNLSSSASGGGTSVSFTPGAALTVNGAVTIGSATTFNGSTFAHVVAGNWTVDGTYSGSTGSVTFTGAGMALGGSGTNSFNDLVITGGVTVAANTVLTVSGNFTTTGSGSWTRTPGGSGTITFSGASKAITGTGIAFGNITISGSYSTASSLTIAGSLAVGGSFTATAGTITLTGASKTISGAGTIAFNALSVTGSTSTAIGFSLASDLGVIGTFTASAGTTTFTGTSSLSGSANLYNVTLNGSRLQLGSGSTLGVAGALTLTSGTFDVTTTVPNMVSYNGSGAQSVTATTYDDLTVSGGNTKSLAGGITINGDLTIASSTTLSGGSHTCTLYEGWTNSGTFSAGTSTVQLLGPSDATITGATTFSTLTINKTSSSDVVTLASNVSVGTLNMTNGEINTGSNTLTITTTRTGNGMIVGTITRTHAYANGTAYAFAGPNNTVNFASGAGNVTSITVTVTLGPISGFAGAINREYNYSVTAGGAYNATLKLQYQDAELNGNIESLLSLWKFSTSWGNLNNTTNDSTANWVSLAGQTSIAGRWTLSNGVNIVRWNGSTSNAWSTAGNWTVVSGSPSTPPGSGDAVEIGTVTATSQPTITGAVTVKSITFGSAQAATLTIGSGGSLAVNGNISGSWSANASHTIAVGAQSLTVGGNLVQSAGVSNRVIHLTASSGSITVTGSLTETGGANVTFSGAGSLSIGGDYIYVSGTFTPSASTVTYNGSGSQAVAGVTYNNLSFSKPSGTATLSSSATVNGTLTLSTGGISLINASLTVAGNATIGSGATLNGSASTISVGGDWTNGGTFTPSTSTIVINGTGAQSISSSTFNNLTINKASGTATLAGNIAINGNLTISNGTFDLGIYTADRSSLGGTMTIAGGATVAAGGANNFPKNYSTYTLASAGTAHYNGTMAQTIDPHAYGNLTTTGGGASQKSLSGVTTVGGDLLINSGSSFNAGSYLQTVYGNWTNNGTFAAATSTVALAGSGKTLSGATSFNNLTVTGTYTLLSDLTVNGAFIIAGGVTAGSTTTTIAGDFTNNGTFTSSGTVTFTGTASRTLALNSGFNSSGTVNFNGTVTPILASTTAPTLGNVNINNSGGVTSTSNWTVNGAFVIASGVTFSAGGYSHIYRGAFTNNGTITSSGTLTFSPSSAVTLQLAGTAFTSTGVVNFAGTGAITMSTGSRSFNTVNVTNSNAAGITLLANWTLDGTLTIGSGVNLNAGAGLTHTIAGNLTNNGTFSGGTSTIVMNSPANGSIEGSGATTFYNLTINGDVTAGSNFSVAGNFINNGNFTPTGQAVTFTGSSPTTIGGSTTPTPFDYLIIAKSAATATLAVNLSGLNSLSVTGGTFDLGTYTVSEDAGGGSLGVSAGATLKIGGTRTLPSFGSVLLNGTSTVDYYGSGSQAIASEDYGNLMLGTGGVKSASSDLTINGNLTIGSGATFAAGAFTHTVNGNWTNSGIFTPGSGTVELAGSSNTTITGATAFNMLTVSKSSSSGTVTLASPVTVATLDMTQGRIATGANAVTITGNRTGSGLIIGTITRTHAFSAGTSYAFEGPNNTVTFASGGTLPTSVTVVVALSATGATASMDTIPRYYTLTQTGGSDFSYTLRLHYEDAEITSPNTESTLKLWRRTGTNPNTWTRVGSTSNSTANNWVESSGITTVGTWSLSSRTLPRIVLALAQDVAAPAPGDEVRYTISYLNAGDAPSTSTIVSAAAPTRTSYVTGTIQINGVTKTDVADVDEVTVNGSNITVNLNTVTASASGTITYRVRIN
jgi:hypothetical protein